MRRLISRGLAVFSSLGLSCVLLLLLGVLTWLGTLSQVDTGLYEVQRKYFESYVLVHDVGGVPVPLPGANLVLTLLFVNLVVGGLLRLRRSRSRIGIALTHLGMALLLVAGFVKLHFSEDGQLTLLEGGRANAFQSYHRWELAISRDLGDGRIEEHLVPQEDWLDAVDGTGVLLVSDALPFDLSVRHVQTNCRRVPEGPLFEAALPVVDGDVLLAEPPLAEHERNVMGAYVTIPDPAHGTHRDAILWGHDAAPLSVPGATDAWTIALRKERYALPFTLVLDDFTKENHPRTGMPSAFSSDVTVIEGTAARPVHISMNEPLRSDGLVLYQASWGPRNARPGDPLFSTLAVVRNPADQLPLVACIVIALGLLLHFTGRLVRHLEREARTP